VLAAAFEIPPIEAIRGACRHQRWRMGRIVPAAVALASVCVNETFSWIDGNIELEVTQSEGVVTSTRSRLATPEARHQPDPDLPADLSALGSNAGRFAAAYGAGIGSANEPVALDPPLSIWGTWKRRYPVFVPALVLVASFVMAILSPLGASWSRKRAQAQVSSVTQEQWNTVTTALADLDRVTQVLREVHDFRASRSSSLGALAELARLLPNGAVLVSVDVDADRGHATVLTDHPAATLASLRTSTVLGSVEAVGSASQAVSADGTAQQITITFRVPSP
jgi:hypothetical protein